MGFDEYWNMASSRNSRLQGWVIRLPACDLKTVPWIVLAVFSSGISWILDDRESWISGLNRF